VLQYSLAVGFRSGALRIFDIESTSTITERKVTSSPVAAILFVRSSSYPAVRTGTGAGTESPSAPSYAFPSTRALASAMGSMGMGGMGSVGADRGMADMFDMSSPIKEKEKEKERPRVINSAAERLLLFTAGE
jgi:hypothetical protein